MLLANFKIGGYKVFGDVVELNMLSKMKNASHLLENTIVIESDNFKERFLKSSILYGANNTGKSSLLDGVNMMKTIVLKGDIEWYLFDVYRNFSCKTDDYIRFEVSYTNKIEMFTYGIEFKDKESIGEYLYLDDDLLFSRGAENELEGTLLKEKGFKNRVEGFPTNKLISTYFNEYFPDLSFTKKYFKPIKDLFLRIAFIDNGLEPSYTKEIIDFWKDEKKMILLNSMISNSNLFIERRNLLTDEDVRKHETLNQLIDAVTEKKVSKKNMDSILSLLNLSTVYLDKDGSPYEVPSILYDSVGTNKYINLLIHVIDAILDEKILLIDELDSSLHYLLTRTLLNVMNSYLINNSQFIMTTHDIKLLDQNLLRKDQINFVIRENNNVDIVSLADFKSNSDIDIRKSSNFEKMYIEEKIVPLPYVDMYEILLGFENYAKE